MNRDSQQWGDESYRSGQRGSSGEERYSDDSGMGRASYDSDGSYGGGMGRGGSQGG